METMYPELTVRPGGNRMHELRERDEEIVRLRGDVAMWQGRALRAEAELALLRAQRREAA